MRKTFKMANWSTIVKAVTCGVGILLYLILLFLFVVLGSWIWEWLALGGVAGFLLIVAPWNATAKVLAYFAGSALLGGGLLLADAGLFEWVMLLSLLLTIIPLSYIFAPLGCVADTKQLLIKRAIGPIVIPYEQILFIEVKEKVEFSPIKAFGVSGVFAFYGSFILKGGDTIKAYVTDFAVPMVRIQTVRRSYYITLAEPEEFVKTVKQHLV